MEAYILLSNTHFQSQENFSPKSLSPHILIVEDNEGDEDLLRLAFSESYLKDDYTFAYDGEQALDYLFKLGDYKAVPTPDLIILDLQLPRIDGYEILARLKATTLYAQTPIIIFTGKFTPDCEIICKTYPNLTCIEKPNNFDTYDKIVHASEKVLSENFGLTDNLSAALG